MIVMKFGGTSVESQEAIARVARIVASQQQRRPIVVVSAMGKTTNKLLQTGHEAAAGRREQALAIADDLRAAHLTHGLALAGAGSAELERYIRAHFEWLEELVRGLSIVGELSPRSMDAVASVGERISSLIVTFAFRAAGIPVQQCQQACVTAKADDGGNTANDQLQAVITCAIGNGDAGSGHGLIGMRERVALLGGELSARSRPGHGYEVRARIPLEAPAG